MALDPTTTNWPGPAAPSSTSTSLLERIKTREPEAWHRLVDLYGPLIYRWCRQCGFQKTDAADIAQEVFARVAASLADFRRDRPGDSFRGWLWTITHNKIRDHFRRLKGEAHAQGGTHAQLQLAQIPEDSPESVTNAPPNVWGAGLEHRALELVRVQVEARTWQAFWRLVVDGQPPAEVAAELGMTAAAVYKAKYRVIGLVRRELGDLLE